MSAPGQQEDHLSKSSNNESSILQLVVVPDGCTDEIVGIERLTSGFNRRYNACPVVFTGTLKDAIKEAFQSKEVIECIDCLLNHLISSRNVHYLSISITIKVSIRISSVNEYYVMKESSNIF